MPFFIPRSTTTGSRPGLGESKPGQNPEPLLPVQNEEALGPPQYLVHCQFYQLFVQPIPLQVPDQYLMFVDKALRIAARWQLGNQSIMVAWVSETFPPPPPVLGRMPRCRHFGRRRSRPFGRLTLPGHCGNPPAEHRRGIAQAQEQGGGPEGKEVLLSRDNCCLYRHLLRW